MKKAPSYVPGQEMSAPQLPPVEKAEAAVKALSEVLGPIVAAHGADAVAIAMVSGAEALPAVGASAPLVASVMAHAIDRIHDRGDDIPVLCERAALSAFTPAVDREVDAAMDSIGPIVQEMLRRHGPLAVLRCLVSGAGTIGFAARVPEFTRGLLDDARHRLRRGDLPGLAPEGKPH